MPESPPADPTRRPGAAIAAVDPQRLRSFLALDMGASLGDDGDVAGIRLADLAADPELKAMATGLWHQLKAPKPLAQRIEEAGLTVGDLFTPGMSEFVTTSSTPDELVRYRQKLAFRADLLEGLLEETLAELDNVDTLTAAAVHEAGAGPLDDPVTQTD